MLMAKMDPAELHLASGDLMSRGLPFGKSASGSFSNESWQGTRFQQEGGVSGCSSKLISGSRAGNGAYGGEGWRDDVSGVGEWNNMARQTGLEFRQGEEAGPWCNQDGGFGTLTGAGSAWRDSHSFAGNDGLQYPEPRPLQLPERDSAIAPQNEAAIGAMTNAVSKWAKNFDHSSMVRKINKQIFKNKGFRTHQEEIINAAMMGEDVFVLMPTGGGKSLCYQVSALAEDGVTVVISPLVSLMQDQVYNLRLSGVSSVCLHANSEVSEINRAYQSLQNPDSPEAKLIYITPEKFSKSHRMRSEMAKCAQRGMLKRVVIDEAHCVSEWGHDFRPDYKLLGCLKEQLNGVSIMALTATATERVRTDIRRILDIPKSYMFIQSFNRPNLLYEVRQKKKAYLEELIDFIKEKYKGETGIVYCLSKHRCEEMAESLSKAGIRAKPYHAGLDDEVRRKNQDDWSNDKVFVICATIAFGMGINKPDVRFVVHDSLPKSMEGYYQESGRAGRDGKISHCILFYSYRDKLTHDKMSEEDFKDKKLRLRGQDLIEAEKQRTNLRNNLNSIVSYCENCYECRRVLQMHYFGETRFSAESCKKTCDNCWSGKTGSSEERDVTTEAKAYVNIVEYFQRRNMAKSISFLIKVFRGSQAKETKEYQNVQGFGAGKGMKESDAERLYRLLVSKGIVLETSEHNAGSVFGGTVTSLTVGDCRLLESLGLKMAFDKVPEKSAEGKKSKAAKDKDGKRQTAKEKRQPKSHSKPVYHNIESDSDNQDPITDLTTETSPDKLLLNGNEFISKDQQVDLNARLLELRDRMFEEKRREDSYVPHSHFSLHSFMNLCLERQFFTSTIPSESHLPALPANTLLCACDFKTFYAHAPRILRTHFSLPHATIPPPRMRTGH